MTKFRDSGKKFACNGHQLFWRFLKFLKKSSKNSFRSKKWHFFARLKYKNRTHIRPKIYKQKSCILPYQILACIQTLKLKKSCKMTPKINTKLCFKLALKVCFKMALKPCFKMALRPCFKLALKCYFKMALKCYFKMALKVCFKMALKCYFKLALKIVPILGNKARGGPI